MATHRIRLRGPWHYHKLPRSFSLSAPITAFDQLSKLEEASTHHDMVAVPDNWSVHKFDDAERVVMARGFNKPTGIENQKLFIRVEGDHEFSSVYLNGTAIDIQNGTCEVTTKLEEKNWLVLDIAASAANGFKIQLFDEVLLIIED